MSAMKPDAAETLRERIERALAALNVSSWTISKKGAMFASEDDSDDAEPLGRPVRKPSPNPRGRSGVAVHPEAQNEEAMAGERPWPCFTTTGRRA
jgi:hypothetical protein